MRLIFIKKLKKIKKQKYFYFNIKVKKYEKLGNEFNL